MLPIDIPAGLWRVPDSWTPQQRLERALYLARWDIDSPELEALARPAAEFATEQGRAAAVLASVQALPFVRDAAGEWIARGAYTAVHGGDCLRLAPLLVAVAQRAGLRGELLWLRPDDPAVTEDHATARLWVDDSWWWAEATIKGARLGENPWAASERVGEKGGL